MARSAANQGKVRFIPATLAAAGLALAIPATGLAVVQTDNGAELPESISYFPFTPAKADPALARRVAAAIGEDGLRFTPASKPSLAQDRTVTVAVRVDDATARAISVRDVVESAGNDKSRVRALAIEPSSFNLGVARGYQSFAQAKPEKVTLGVREMGMPDLSTFRPAETEKESSSRFQSRLTLEKEDSAGRSPRTLEGAGDQKLDLSTSYRVIDNVNVTAGVRLSKDNNRLTPLTDGVEDDQAVYVGTRVSF